MYWSVRTGTEIHCWKDNWVPRVGPLIEHVKDSNRPITNSMLKDMVIDDRTWNLEAFRDNLLKGIVQKIMDISPPYPLAGPDKVCWSHASNGSFLIKNAYQMLTEKNGIHKTLGGRKPRSIKGHIESSFSYG